VSTQRVARKVQDLQRRISDAREACRVLDEQLSVWSEAYDDARLRSLMAETPQSDHDLADVKRHYDVARRERERREDEIARMVLERDRLLREWTPKEVS
jgi:outer membrane protein TolC